MYIRQSKLRHLREYQYSAIDHSLVSKYILKPFYTNYFIHVFPMSMAPNLITLTGFFFIVFNVSTLLYYNFTLDTDCPPWVYATWSIGLFLYQTFDACDGTQARRTQQSGPLGELFDHGVDALNTTLGALIFAGAVNLGYGWETILVLFAGLCAFYLTTWEEYHTGTLYLGLVNGPVEGVLTLCGIYALTAIVGRGSFWQQPLVDILHIAPEHVPEFAGKVSAAAVYVFYGAAMLVFNIVQSSLNVIRARRAKGLAVAPALAGLLPFFGPWALAGVYLHLTPSVLYQHLLPFVGFLGLSFAYQVGLMITAHLTKSKYPYCSILVVPLLVAVVDAAGAEYGVWTGIFRHGNEGALVLGMMGLALGVHGSFIVDVIMNICDYLDIWCLTIKYRRDLGVVPPKRDDKEL